jgi:peptidyl-prolyl cis-trans isomerase C
MPKRVRNLAGRLFRSRLLQFLAGGAAIFLLVPTERDSGSSAREVRVSARELRSLLEAETRRQDGRPLTEAEARAVAERHRQEELLYREALRLGLDRGDPVVRQRLVQKMLFLARELGGASAWPTEADLLELHASEPEAWAEVEALRFEHVFGLPANRARLEALRARLVAPGAAPPHEQLGDAFPLPRDVPLTGRDRLASRYGRTFVEQVAALPLGQWSEPLQSVFGWHLVRLLERQPARVRPFAEVRSEVALRLLETRSRQAVERYVAELAARFRVTFEAEPWAEAP